MLSTFCLNKYKYMYIWYAMYGLYHSYPLHLGRYMYFICTYSSLSLLLTCLQKRIPQWAELEAD